MLSSSRILLSKSVSHLASRQVTRSLSLAVRYHQIGDPSEVLKLETVDGNIQSKRLEANEIALKMLAAPINPMDLNMVEGTYGTKPSSLPAFAGNEGVAEVMSVGPGVKSIAKGDWVIPMKPSTFGGTWRQHAVASEQDVMKVPSTLPLPYAATLAVNPCTAYRLLHDFVDLKPGDYILQNGANSMVGQAIIQLAKLKGIKTINCLREDNPYGLEKIRFLTNLGGDINITNAYLSHPGFAEILKELPPIKLAFNCVGGEAATDMSRVVGDNATIVTYGGMSKQAFVVPEDLLQEKQLTLKSFWLNQWYEAHPSQAARQPMFDELITYIQEEKLQFFFEMRDLDDFDYALQKATEPFYFRKVVLQCDFPDRLAEHDALPEEDYEIFESPAYG